MADYITMKQIPGGTVTAKDDRILNDANIASSGVIYGCQVSFLGENMIHMNAGYGIIKGGIFEIEDHTEYIGLPASGTKLGQIYIHVDFSADDKIQLVKEVADSRHAMVQNPNANFVNGIYEIQLCTFNATATNITDVVQTFPVVSNQVLDSLQEILANTTPGLKAGALALKSVAESVNGIDIRYDSATQKPQWKERGADTWNPFKSENAKEVYDLGTGTSFNIRELFPDVEYEQLTADNFIVAITSISNENTGVVFYQNLNDYTGAGFAGSFIKTYVNGLLSVTVSAKGTLRTGSQSSQSVVRSTSDRIGYKVYMII